MTIPPANNKRVHETPIVENCGGRWMSWLGKGSATQMYCSLLFSANMILRADPAADIYEVVAAGGAISSASACVFFGAKLLCDRVVTDIISFRNIGDKDEFVRISVLGAVRKQSFSVEPSDIQLLAHDGKDSYKFQVGERQLSLDTATGTCVNRKALEILLQGKPLVTRRGKTSKKPRA
uniref:Uncharacterized protein n=1 Tax=Globisporangium ultimum (strain ATCC 200006 / CBS 805.95 / DAOM BR144) TaxID=431595 RepID=K3WV15_GLOUD